MSNPKALFVGGVWSGCLRQVPPGVTKVEMPHSERGRVEFYRRERIKWDDNGRVRYPYVFVGSVSRAPENTVLLNLYLLLDDVRDALRAQSKPEAAPTPGTNPI